MRDSMAAGSQTTRATATVGLIVGLLVVFSLKLYDYRYTLRDPTLILYALQTIGYHDEALDFFDWLEALCLSCQDNIQIMYRLDGGREMPEQVLGGGAGGFGAAIKPTTPPRRPLNDLTPLTARQQWLGYATFGILALILARRCRIRCEWPLALAARTSEATS